MTERRKYQRFDSRQDVYLYHGVSKYMGRLDNISCSGALVRIESLPQVMHPGDVCYLAFTARPESILCECKVVRLLSTHVGVQFSRSEASA